MWRTETGSRSRGRVLTAELTSTRLDGLLEEGGLVDAIEPIKRPRGRPRKRPKKLCTLTQSLYDTKKCREALRRRRIKARKGEEKGKQSSEKLGRHRWVVEGTLAWLAKYRRLTIRYERRDDIHEAFLHLGCSLICLNYLS